MPLVVGVVVRHVRRVDLTPELDLASLKVPPACDCVWVAYGQGPVGDSFVAFMHKRYPEPESLIEY